MGTCFSISLVTEYRSNLISVFCMYNAKACRLRISVIIKSWMPGCCTCIKIELEPWNHLVEASIKSKSLPWLQHHVYHLLILLGAPNWAWNAGCKHHSLYISLTSLGHHPRENKMQNKLKGRLQQIKKRSTGPELTLNWKGHLARDFFYVLIVSLYIFYNIIMTKVMLSLYPLMEVWVEKNWIQT